MDKPKGEMLKFHSDTVQAVKKEINLEQDERMEEALNHLEEWVKMQNHFLKKDIPRIYLETTLVTCKGSLERSKQRIDKMCTLRTLMPEFFPDNITKELFSPLKEFVSQAHLPTLTKEHYRVYMMKLLSDEFPSSILQLYFKYTVVASEYCKIYDYNSGFIMILDYRDINILNFMTKVNPMDLKHIFTLMTEGYGMRIKKINIITASKVVDSLVSLFKQVLRAKLGGRIQVHKDLNSLHEVVEKHLLPEDYGGDEKPLAKLFDQWLDIHCSKKNVELYREISEAKTDETCRTANNFNEQYVGMPGSFRALSVD